MHIPSGQEYNRLCGFGVDVLTGVDVMSNDNFPFPSLDKNELDEFTKTPESSSYDSELLSRDLFPKTSSAKRTSSKERGRRDLERIKDD